MTGKTIRTFAAALLLGAATLATSGLVASQPAMAADAKITTKAVGDALKEAQELQKNRDFKGALAKAREARGAAKGGEAAVVNKYIVFLAQQAGDNQTALSTIDEMISSGEIGKTEGEKAALPLALKLGNQEKAMAYARRSPATWRSSPTPITKRAHYQQVVDCVQPTVDNGKPDKTSLELLASSLLPTPRRRRFCSAPSRCSRPTTRTTQHWHDLIKMVLRGKTLDDHQNLEMYRLRMTTGDLKT